MPADFSTPRAALLSLEDAYKSKDINAAVAAKDFLFEAKEMLMDLQELDSLTEDLIKQTAEVLELAFRKQMETRGFPDFSQGQCRVVSQKDIRADLVELVEECVFPNGSGSSQILHAARNGTGWHIVILPPAKGTQSSRLQ